MVGGTRLKADVKTIGLDERAGEDLKASEKASKGMMLTAESASDLVDADATHATHIAKRIEGALEIYKPRICCEHYSRDAHPDVCL